MILFVIKSTIILVVFFSFYKFFLEKESMHVFKRFYLLGSVVLSLIIPLNKMEVPNQEIGGSEIASTNPENILGILPGDTQINYSPIETFTENQLNNINPGVETRLSNWFIPFIIFIYISGFLFFLIRFVRNLHMIYAKVKHGFKIKTKENTKVLLIEKVVPHSFLNMLFLNKYAFETKSIAPEVLLHEQTHINQKHTLDILFFEIMQIIFWFSPFYHLIKRSVKLNHEFLADQKVISLQNPVNQYQNILLQFAGSTQYPVTNNINYSLTKKRLKMMTKHTSKVKSITWVLALIPVVLGLILFLSSKALIAQDIYIKIINKNEIIINDTIHVRPENISSEIKKIINNYRAKQKENITAIVQAPENMEMDFVIDLNKKIRNAGVNIRKYTSDQKPKDPSTNKQVQKDKTFNGASEKMIKESMIPNTDLSTLKTDFMQWWTYHSKNIILSSNFIPFNENSNQISKNDFLKKLTSGKFIALKLISKDSLTYYKLFKLDKNSDKGIGGTIKNVSAREYKHFKMEGISFPKFSFTDLNGKTYTSENTKGKTIILKCWFISCKPCVAEFPELNLLVKKYQNRNDILFISLAFDSKKALQDFLIKKPFSYAVVPNQREFMEDILRIHTYPTHFVIDKKGTIKKVVNKVDEMLPAFNKEIQ